MLEGLWQILPVIQLYVQRNEIMIQWFTILHKQTVLFTDEM